MKKLFFIMSNLQTNYHFKLYFQKVATHTGGNQTLQGQSVAKAWTPM